jgi:ring-1,2-phenylacetyl-CoA epoxidase subunit PaaC
MQSSIHVLRAPAVDYLLRLGDTCLIQAQRLGEWCGHAPIVEEDIALTNMALDLVGQARAVLTRAGQLEAELGGVAHDEDQLAFLRDERDFLNPTLAELPRGDFAVTTLRNFALATFLKLLWTRLEGSSDAELAAIAGKAVKEVAYHRDHATRWVVRLGDGTELSHQRMQAGLEQIWRYVGELFDVTWVTPALIEQGVAVDVRALEPGWRAYVDDVLAEAALEAPDVAQRPAGGRRGIHTEAMGYLLAEMQHIARSHPGATW